MKVPKRLGIGGTYHNKDCDKITTSVMLNREKLKASPQMTEVYTFCTLFQYDQYCARMFSQSKKTREENKRIPCIRNSRQQCTTPHGCVGGPERLAVLRWPGGQTGCEVLHTGRDSEALS